MAVPRRTFLAHAACASALAAVSCRPRAADEGALAAGRTAAAGPGPPDWSTPSDPGDRWAAFRRQFALSPDSVHMSALLIASHPGPVREAIDTYRAELDSDPVLTLREHNRARQHAAREAAAKYIGAGADDIALTDSTTMGVALVCNGLALREGDEVLTTAKDYYVTHESARQAAARSGASVRQIDLYEDIADVSRGGLAEAVRSAVGPKTRLVALTWVHSSTGLKMPIEEIGEAIAAINARRGDEDRVLLSIDGVHGFGIENLDLRRLKLDFFAAGCHKWLFGPRGTGILWARGAAWAAARPLIPSFTDDGTWEAWLNGEAPEGPVEASRMTPGGFKAFEHQWALPAAFDLHQQLGKAAVERRTHELARQLKEGLRGMRHVSLVTPVSDSLSSGIVCFDVDGLSPWTAVKRLRERRVIASVTPYAVRHVRLAPSVRNTPGEVDRALAAIRELG